VRLDGERKIYERDADSGYRIRFHFCPNCGSTLYWEGDRNPAVCGVAVGAFDTSPLRRPAIRSGRNGCTHGSACRKGWSTISRADRLPHRLGTTATPRTRHHAHSLR
jgi:hypothetical protein